MYRYLGRLGGDGKGSLAFSVDRSKECEKDSIVYDTLSLCHSISVSVSFSWSIILFETMIKVFVVSGECRL